MVNNWSELMSFGVVVKTTLSHVELRRDVFLRIASSSSE